MRDHFDPYRTLLKPEVRLTQDSNMETKAEGNAPQPSEEHTWMCN